MPAEELQSLMAVKILHVTIHLTLLILLNESNITPCLLSEPSVHVRAPSDSRGFVDKPRPIGRGGRR